MQIKGHCPAEATSVVTFDVEEEIGDYILHPHQAEGMKLSKRTTHFDRVGQGAGKESIEVVPNQKRQLNLNVE